MFLFCFAIASESPKAQGLALRMADYILKNKQAEDESNLKTIKRKTMLYQTGVEYGDYTMNHVQGCAHGCKFPCYAFLMKKRFGQIKDYEDWIEPVLVSNTLELLDKEIPKLRDKIQSVQLCFTTDPFMQGYPEVSQMSIEAIRKLNDCCLQNWQNFQQKMNMGSH